MHIGTADRNQQLQMLVETANSRHKARTAPRLRRALEKLTAVCSDAKRLVDLRTPTLREGASAEASQRSQLAEAYESAKGLVSADGPDSAHPFVSSMPASCVCLLRGTAESLTAVANLSCRSIRSLLALAAQC